MKFSSNSPVRTLVLGTLFFIATFSQSVTPAFSQQEIGDKAVLAFSVDLEKIANSKSLKAITGGKPISEYFPMDEDGAEVFDNLSRISGFAAAPQGIGPDAFEATNFIVVLEMKNEKIIKQMKSELKRGFIEVEKDGKTILKADGPGAPPFFARQDGNRFIFASEDYLFAKPESVASSKLNELLKGVKSKPAYLVANLDGARDMLTELSKMANENADFMTKQYISLMDQVATISFAGDIDGNPLFHLQVTGHNEKENKQIKLKIDAAIGLLKGVTELGMAQLEKEQPKVAQLAKELLEGLTVELKGDVTAMTLKRPMNFEEKLATSVKIAIELAKRASERSQNENKMKQIALSKHNYYDTYRKFPFDPELTKTVSWRVRVLPFIEESRLHDRFDLDQKWSSDTNKKLIGSFPDVFRFSNGATVSYIKPDKLPASFQDIADGTSNTIVFVENRKAKMTPWTKPEGITPEVFAKMVKSLDDGDSLIVAFYDGSVTHISNATSTETILKLCDPSDGKVIESDEIK